LSKITEYIDKKIASKIGEKEEFEIRKIVREYYSLKEIETGFNETDIIRMLFIDELTIEEIAAKLNMSTRQIRRKKEKYLNFLIKVIYLYLKNKDKETIN